MAKYQVKIVSHYYEVYMVEAEDEAIAEEIVYSGEGTLVDSYSGGEDEIYDIELIEEDEVENG